MRFQPGQTVVRRCVHRNGRIAAAESGRVISDDHLGLMIWVGGGSGVMRRATLDGELVRALPVREKLAIPTMLKPMRWRGHGVLILTPPGAAHSIWWFFGEDASFDGWYVNLEAPAVRWRGGIDIRDQALDIWVHPDLSWRWKDEDEFADRTDHPLFWTSQEAVEIRAEGERMIALAEKGAYPFDGTHVDFMPDPSWTPSTFPAIWDFPPQILEKGSE
ncbi:hypothetical protein Rhe02_27390 [Rhizocola hellebori]|uniref:DUF402 domain-containing protein n=1 Tax=Rhizocola hellebori TaxID=1392758 RepID=A0A8J3Q7G9_9ACTN|nr:DUF402 domain-containing protein [Rhizocola hellebori]GIH04672.1 hypothetical protein Rhe02_27390 [Rhizocola hellebori]